MNTAGLLDRASALVSQGLLPASLDNLRRWIASGTLPTWALESLGELVDAVAVSELNDRFFRELEFGTGGMRGRTIGRVVTVAERGTQSPQGTPEHAAVGCNNVNDFTVIRATVGLFRHAKAHLDAGRRPDVPRLVIAHDVRHFSRYFAALAASTWTRLGGTAFVFDGPRSTPQLSFSVRRLRATCGVVITASHNPPHDNGFKAYFEDGGQVVEPHASAIIRHVAEVDLAEVARHFEVDLSRAVLLPAPFEEAYLAALEELVPDRTPFRKARLKVVFTSLHGTGRIATVPLLKRFGIRLTEVEDQAVADPRFPTVKSPNPENAEALARGIELAKETKADLVLATDPDCDRMGAAVRTASGEYQLLTGNQMGALLADFRIARLKREGVLPKKGTQRAALIKTFVTSPLQDAIGAAHGVKVVNTLTGFKWIADKIHDYERGLAESLSAEGVVLDYDATSAAVRAELLLERSTYYVFGGEESYGYLATDAVRDKDGNAACLLLCELAAAARAEGRTLADVLDDLYLKHGYYGEALGQIYYEGAEGAARIARILASYRTRPPKSLAGARVRRVRDFGREVVKDPDGKRIPKQDLFFVELSDGTSYAVRGSGTEPKIKFYFFGRQKVSSRAALPRVRAEVEARLAALRQAVEADAAARAG